MQGILIDGEKKASKFMAIKNYFFSIKKICKYSPFLGTLNLKINKKEMKKIKEEMINSKKINEFVMGKDKFFEINLIPCFLIIKEKKIKAHILINKNSFKKDQIEIIYSENLRKKFKLKNNDVLKIEF